MGLQLSLHTASLSPVYPPQSQLQLRSSHFCRILLSPGWWPYRDTPLGPAPAFLSVLHPPQGTTPPGSSLSMPGCFMPPCLCKGCSCFLERPGLPYRSHLESSLLLGVSSITVGKPCPSPPSSLLRPTRVPVVCHRPCILLVVTMEFESSQVVVQLCLGGDNVDGGLVALLAGSPPFIWA